jgi:hypothetical protein
MYELGLLPCYRGGSGTILGSAWPNLKLVNIIDDNIWGMLTIDKTNQ